ncbi:Uncharacterized conserved protein [Phaffia rhodozyma]|uniref:Uncharacterized conserved protein n=1 Tax=Phaffia rhodozyma TaxID=264483 RepID=A0A0F7SQZ2_PHARH|nr:Uncharacterized conserved protein [Phaffia rhodozyma]
MPPRNQPTNPAEILPSLQSLVQTNAYSAHQKTRTTAARLSAHGHVDAATEVLFEISKALLKKGEVGSGVDLAVFMINTTESKNELFGDVVRGRVTNLIALCPSTANWRKTVVDASINLSTKAPNLSPAGDPLLLQYIGELYYKEKDFVKAEPHLISSGTRDSGKILGAMGFEWCQEGAVDPSPYLLRLVLPHLLLSPPSILPARSTLDTFLSHLLSSNPSFLIERIPFPSADNADEILYTTLPVANYLQLLIRSVQRSGSETAKVSWTELGSKYRSWGKPWLRDEHIKEAVQYISTNTFKIPAPRGAGGNNMMADLMSSLFGGGM